jgi:hypothetical protein
VAREETDPASKKKKKPGRKKKGRLVKHRSYSCRTYLPVNEYVELRKLLFDRGFSVQAMFQFICHLAALRDPRINMLVNGLEVFMAEKTHEDNYTVNEASGKIQRHSISADEFYRAMEDELKKTLENI